MATTTNAVQQERIEADVTAEQKALFERAAALTGRSLAEFVVNSAQEAAEDALETQEVAITLSARDSAVLMEALMNPPEPNEALREAFRLHREMFGE